MNEWGLSLLRVFQGLFTCSQLCNKLCCCSVIVTINSSIDWFITVFINNINNEEFISSGEELVKSLIYGIEERNKGRTNSYYLSTGRKFTIHIMPKRDHSLICTCSFICTCNERNIQSIRHTGYRQVWRRYWMKYQTQCLYECPASRCHSHVNHLNK